MPSCARQAAAQVKVKDVPAFLSQRVTRENITNSTMTWAANYKKTYIDTGSFTPMRHLLVGTFCLAYTVAWPQEYKHYKHEQAVKHGLAEKH